MKHTRWIAAALFLLTLSSGPSGHAQSPLAVSPTLYLPIVIKAPAGGQTPEQRQMAEQVLALVNSERATAGCPPLVMNEKLIVAAQGQSRDMAELDFFDHTNPDPTRSTVGKRATVAGYSWSRIGENIAAGYSTAADVMSGWMSSSGHRDNILNCSYTEIGVGYYFEADDQPFPGKSWAFFHYWTQVFAKP